MFSNNTWWDLKTDFFSGGGGGLNMFKFECFGTEILNHVYKKSYNSQSNLRL